MSKIIKEISAPVLNNPNFGDNLKEQFDNINTNFKILANAEFMKGAEGKNVKLTEVPAFVKNAENNYVFTNFGAKLFSTILNIEVTENTVLDDIKNLINTDYPQWDKLFTDAKYSVFDSFKTSDSTYDGTIKLYCYEDEEVYIYSPMNYFRDARIDELNDADANLDVFSDASCSYIYDGENFKTYTLYPTLYYNSILGLICWKVNGEETSIAAQGLQGKNGNTCRVHIIKCTYSDDSTTNIVTTQVINYFYDDWYDINDVNDIITAINNVEKTSYKSINDLFSRTDLYFCIIVNNNDEVYDYTFCTNPSISDENGTITFTVDNSSLIGRKSFLNNFKDMVNNFGVDSIGETKHASLKGFYLPFSNDKKLVHSIYVSSENINNNEKSILNIDVESKDIYTNNDADKNEEVIENSSINIKNHNVNIQEGNLTIGGNIKTTGLQVTVAGTTHASFDNVNAEISTDEINFTTVKMRIKGVDNSSTYSVMEVNNFNEINIGNTNDGEEPDKCLTIRKDTEVNIGGNVKIDGMLQSEFMLPVGSVIMFGLEHTKIPNNWKICNGKSYYVNKQTGDIQEKSNPGRPERPDISGRPDPDTPLIPQGYEEIKTPDLRGRFIVGANNSATEYNDTLSKYYFNAIVDGSNRSGKETVKLTGQQSGIQDHKHVLGGYTVSDELKKDKLHIIDHNTDTNTFNGYKFATNMSDYPYTVNKGEVTGRSNIDALEAHENRPPFYALYYIMKLL